MDKSMISEAIFTNEKEIALCDSMEKVQELIDNLNKMRQSLASYNQAEQLQFF